MEDEITQKILNANTQRLKNFNCKMPYPGIGVKKEFKTNDSLVAYIPEQIYLSNLRGVK